MELWRGFSVKIIVGSKFYIFNNELFEWKINRCFKQTRVYLNKLKKNKYFIRDTVASII